jgi:hypothetical protein
MRFLNRCRCVAADNPWLSAAFVVVPEPLLIMCINSGFHIRTVADTTSKTRVSGSYSKITYNYNSYTSTYIVTNHIQQHTQIHIQAHTITINTYIAIYNYIMFMRYAYHVQLFTYVQHIFTAKLIHISSHRYS